MIHITINGVSCSAEEGTKVLKAAMDNGIFIPSLCSHPALEAWGGCRLCVVEVKRPGESEPAITTACAAVCPTGSIEELAHAMSVGCNCDFGKGAGRMMEWALADFEEEITGHIRKKRCPALSCAAFYTMHILPDLCTGCGDCVDECPEDAIEGKNRFIHMIDNDICERCGKCAAACPENAIVKAGPVKPRTPARLTNAILCSGGEMVNEHILIIEDEAAIQSILVELLTDAGYKVTTAGDGLTGIAKFREQRYSLVLLDIMLPKLDGYTVCRLIRSESDVPVIMLTALDEEQAQIKAFELKADDYITKPFSLTLVLLRVEAVLRRSRQAEPPTLSFDHIRLDPVSREVFRGSEPAFLTHIEFDLLELFLRNPNRVFTRDNLLNQVWGYDFVGDEKVVNIHIMNLRRKLGQNLIDTIRGVGYRLGKENTK